MALVKIRPFFSFCAFAAVLAVLVFDNPRVIVVAASIASITAFFACIAGIQAQVSSGVKQVDWGDLIPPFILMWVGFYQLAKIIG
ncbi:hypothetical protein D9X30_1689 (plasmid) [Cupriavidus sp. U2]|uniref:hypothetical protein n=1 Tax=Cupriavidus sp. U2 TaxID=2920269 RepID=UPI00129E378B|nr:hypothetical protein [Cupriavidus sp. U2]KAI3593379.1 hypothetical protein D9X30_1689 [Cupriavidus sp. U2]